MEEEGIDVEQVMKTIDKEVAKRASASHDTSGFDDSEEWAQVYIFNPFPKDKF